MASSLIVLDFLGCYNKNDDEATVEQIFDLINDIKLLKSVGEDIIQSLPPSRSFHVLPESTYSITFEGNYMDPRGLLSPYRGEISVMIKEWVKNPKNYIMPYTSVVTS